MARQPKRSAFALTSNSNSILKVALVVCLCTSGARGSDSVAIGLSSESVPVVGAQQPKFGDRLQPRHRQLGANQPSSSSSFSVNKINENIIVNSSDSISNNQYVQIDVDPNTGASYLSGRVVGSNDFNLRRSDAATTVRDDSKSNDFSRIVDNAVLPVAQQRGQLQKLRRNDYDVEIDNDLAEHLINVSKADRLIEMSTEFFIVPSSTPNPVDHGHQRGHNHHSQHPSGPRQSTPRSVLILAPRTTAPNVSTVPPTVVTSAGHIGGLRKEPWVVPVLVLASLCMIMMAAFEIFVLFKAWRTSPSRRHLFLGQMLLLGLFACAGLGAVLTATPTVVSCATVRFGVGVAYALVFAALLVKCVFLISLNGGVYLPAPYQGLLLLFAVLIQVAVGAQWLLTQPPDIQVITIPAGPELGGTFSMLITSTDITRFHGSTVITLCKTQFSEMLLSLIYVVFLIFFVAILAIKSRGIRDNYREATYIGLAIGGTIPIWLGWTLCGLAVTDRHKDACLAFGLIATSATVFLVMFMPKGRQLAAMGKEGLYVEDREEQFSSLSRAGSGYSPSFFHFKPIKYGVMGGVPNSGTNTGNGTSSKHAATLGGGLFMRPDETNLYTTLEPTLSSNPNVYFQRSGGVHPGMMY